MDKNFQFKLFDIGPKIDGLCVELSPIPIITILPDKKILISLWYWSYNFNIWRCNSQEDTSVHKPKASNRKNILWILTWTVYFALKS